MKGSASYASNIAFVDWRKGNVGQTIVHELTHLLQFQSGSLTGLFSKLRRDPAVSEMLQGTYSKHPNELPAELAAATLYPDSSREYTQILSHPILKSTADSIFGMHHKNRINVILQTLEQYALASFEDILEQSQRQREMSLEGRAERRLNKLILHNANEYPSLDLQWQLFFKAFFWRTERETPLAKLLRSQDDISFKERLQEDFLQIGGSTGLTRTQRATMVFDSVSFIGFLVLIFLGIRWLLCGKSRNTRDALTKWGNILTEEEVFAKTR
jgi:hypothetical protein